MLVTSIGRGSAFWRPGLTGSWEKVEAKATPRAPEANAPPADFQYDAPREQATHGGSSSKAAAANGAAEHIGREARPKNSGAKQGDPLLVHRVTQESSALDLDAGVFTWNDPRRIAASLKRSAEESKRRKAEPYRSALSMLVFYINRAGKNLPAGRRRVLERAKTELRKQFGWQ